MRIWSTRSTFALVLPAALSLQLLVAGSAAADACNGALGDWGWFIGGKVTFAEGGVVRWAPPVSTIPPATGTWTCAPATGTYTVTWQNGFVDTLTVAPDGVQISGTSSTGAKVTGRRVGGVAGNVASSAPSATPAAAPTNQGSSGWTPIGTSGFGKQSTVPIINGAPQRIGPQGRPPPKGAG